MSLIIKGKRVAIEGLIINNFVDDNEPEFKPAKRDPGFLDPVNWLVIHETGGSSAANTKDTFLRRGGHHGAQGIVDYDGTVSCHADLFYDVLWHGNQLNSGSIGFEFVNPYSPLMIPNSKKDIFDIVVDPFWWTWRPSKKSQVIRDMLERKGLKEVPKGYVLPTKPQIEALEKLVPVLCYELNIPFEFPTIKLNKKQPRIKGWRKKAKPGKGIVAHRDFASHADGRYLLNHIYEKTIGYDLKLEHDLYDADKMNENVVTYKVTWTEKEFFA